MFHMTESVFVALVVLMYDTCVCATDTTRDEPVRLGPWCDGRLTCAGTTVPADSFNIQTKVYI